MGVTRSTFDAFLDNVSGTLQEAPDPVIVQNRWVTLFQ